MGELLLGRSIERWDDETMIDRHHPPIDRYTWDRSMAERLIEARGSMSCYELTKQVKAKLGSCDKRSIPRYQLARYQTISRELLWAICEVLGVSVESIIYDRD